MRKMRVAALGAVVGLAAGMGVYASAGNDDLPSGKIEAIQNAKVPSVDDLNLGEKHATLKAFPNSGDLSDIAAVRRAAVACLDQIAAASDMPRPLKARARWFASSRHTSTLGAASKAWVPSERQSQMRALGEAIEKVRNDPGYNSAQSSRQVVEKWEGVRVLGDEAFVLFSGHVAYSNPGHKAWSGGQMQYQLSLKRVGEEWLLADRVQIFTGEMG